MARNLILGNGSLLVAFDKDGFVRDFYFPKVGMDNHVTEKCKHRIGLMIDDLFSWLDEDHWTTKTELLEKTLIGKTTKESSKFLIRITFIDSVYNEKNIFIRKITAENLDNKEHTLKIFFGQEFKMNQNEIGNTAFYYPNNPSIIHYHSNSACLISAKIDDIFFQDFTTGVFGIEGKEGSYKDAEDGELSKNPIEHGRTDSVIAVTFNLQQNETKTTYYWITAGESIEDVQYLNHYIKDKSPEHLIFSTENFWRAWLNKYDLNFYKLDDKLINLFYSSILYTRINCDQGGAIIASADSGMLHGGKDTYSYMWPRDASFISMAMDRAGESQLSRRFYSMMNRIVTPSGYLMHKYLTNGSLGSSWHPWIIETKPVLPIQEDETALTLFGLWHYYQESKDLEFIELIYNSYIKKTADFLIEHIDKETFLPKPSYDLWEEKFGIHTFSVASVVGALQSVSRFSKILGKNDNALKYAKVAEQIKKSLLQHLYDPTRGVFYKSLIKKGSDLLPDKTIDASSCFGIWLFEILEKDDERLLHSIEKTKEILSIKTNTKGLARYEGDKYYNEENYKPGNPWFITTFWYAQISASMAKKEEDLDYILEILDWAGNHTTGANIFSEQLNPTTGQAISAGPLVWSHAEYIRTVFAYLDALKRLGLCDNCNRV